MEPINIYEIANATGGELICGNKDIQVTNVTTNSKEVTEGSLFVPIIGERVDGHNFIKDAFLAGAVAVFTSRGIDEKEIISGYAYIRVDNTLEALQALGKYYRSKYSIPVIGITGSVGKTTTKEMISAALETKKNVLKTAGNMNSQIGLPLMMLRLKKEHEIAVIEMGISEHGEMSRLADIAMPEVAVVTNIGVAHIGQLGSKENIRKEKLNIINCFPMNSGSLYINGDDSLLSVLSDVTGNGVSLSQTTYEKLNDARLIYYGMNEACEYRAEQIQIVGDETHFMYISPSCKEPIILSVLGPHNVGNALVALALAEHYGIEAKIAKEGLRNYKPIAMRGQIFEANGMKIIDDSYNASPDSMKSGVMMLLQLQPAKRRIAILADVLELGDCSYQCHYEVGSSIVEAEYEGTRIDQVITIGNESKAITEAIKNSGSSIVTHSFQNNEEAIGYLKEVIQDKDAILVKGSRGMHTEEIVDFLKNE